MQFGLYAPVPHVTAGSKEIEQSIAGALAPLPAVRGRSRICSRKGDSVRRRQCGLRHHPVCGAPSRARFRGVDIGRGGKLMDHADQDHDRGPSRAVASHPGGENGGLARSAHARSHRHQPGDRLERGRASHVRRRCAPGKRRQVYAGGRVRPRFCAGMWSTSPFSYHGRFYQVEDAQLLLRPATADLPEIFTASRSPRGLDMVARTAIGGSSITTRPHRACSR